MKGVQLHSYIGAAVLLLAGACVYYADGGSDLVGDVRDTDGRPLEGVSVHLFAHAGGRTDHTFDADSAVSDSAGCVQLHRMHAPGSVKFVYSKDGYRSLILAASSGGSFLAHAILAREAGSDSSRCVLQQRDLSVRSPRC